MGQDYGAFLDSKKLVAPSAGFRAQADELPGWLFPFQRDLVAWALRKGRSALFATTGMGKTGMQLVWADTVRQRAGVEVLILAPLAVAQQTVREALKFGIGTEVRYCRSQHQVRRGTITITNYEMFLSGAFDPSYFGAVVMDESSILKNFSGKTKKALVAAFRKTPYRLCCTATPSPNDTVELTNHADFLSVMSNRDMLNIFFTTKGTNGKTDGRFRLKRHAREAFYQWLASWAMSLTRPSDLGYPDGAFVLPPLHYHQEVVTTDWKQDGRLFAAGLKGVTDRAAARRATVEQRVEAAVRLVQSEPDRQWIVWTGLNDESALVTRAVGKGLAVEVKGSDSPEAKAHALEGFARGDVRVLVTKPSIAGYGLNFQGCSRMVFVGLDDSYEDYFQAVRRCWRFGQSEEVHAHIVLADIQEVIYENILRKEKEHQELMRELVAQVSLYEREEIKGVSGRANYQPHRAMELPGWLTSSTSTSTTTSTSTSAKEKENKTPEGEAAA